MGAGDEGCDLKRCGREIEGGGNRGLEEAFDVEDRTD